MSYSIASALVDSFHEGGWPMFPILVIGALLVISAGRYVLNPEPRYLPVVKTLSGATLVLGVLGTVLGVIHSLSGIHEVPPDMAVKLSLMGSGESLNNLALSLFMVFFASVLTAVGVLRASDRAA